MPHPARLALVAFLTLVVSGCGATASTGTTGTTVAPATTAAPSTVPVPSTSTVPQPTATRSTTTTLAIPRSPQHGDEQASQDLISAWAEGNKAAALEVATPSAVATLFAVPYPVGNAVFRGCTVSFPPLICTFGAPGGGDPNAAIIEVSVTEIASGWYDSAVVIET